MKSLYIGIGVVVVFGIGYFVYDNNKRKKMAADAAAANTAAAKAASDLAAKSETEKRNEYKSGALKLADLMQQNADHPTTDIPFAQKLRNTINADIMSDDELKALYEAWLVYTNMYVGTQTKAEIYSDANGVYNKYQIRADDVVQPLQIGEVASTLVSSTAINPVTGKMNFTGSRRQRGFASSWN